MSGISAAFVTTYPLDCFTLISGSIFHDLVLCPGFYDRICDEYRVVRANSRYWAALGAG